jgi:uncharacterized protein (TIGR02246 family)
MAIVGAGWVLPRDKEVAMRAWSAILGFAGLAFVACAAPVAEQVIDYAAEEDVIRGVEARFNELGEAKDAAGAAALFTEDAVVFREDREQVSGRAAIQELLAQQYANRPAGVVETSVVAGTGVARSGELGFQYGTWTSTGTGGIEAADDHGKYLTVYRKVGDVWMIAFDMSVSTRPDSISN